MWASRTRCISSAARHIRQSFSSSSRGIKLRCQQGVKGWSCILWSSSLDSSLPPHFPKMKTCPQCRLELSFGLSCRRSPQILKILNLFPLQYQFTNRVSEDNAELDEEDRGIYWTQDEGAPEDNPGPTDYPLEYNNKYSWILIFWHKCYEKKIFCQISCDVILQVVLKESTVSGWLTVGSWRCFYLFSDGSLAAFSSSHFTMIYLTPHNAFFLLSGILLRWWRIWFCADNHVHWWIHTGVWQLSRFN